MPGKFLADEVKTSSNRDVVPQKSTKNAIDQWFPNFFSEPYFRN